MPFRTQLFRCGRQQQEALALPRQCLHQDIFRANSGRRPLQMMCLVDHEHIPVRRGGVVRPTLIFNQRREATQNQLFLEKGVRIGLTAHNCLAALGIK